MGVSPVVKEDKKTKTYTSCIIPNGGRTTASCAAIPFFPPRSFKNRSVDVAAEADRLVLSPHETHNTNTGVRPAAGLLQSTERKDNLNCKIARPASLRKSSHATGRVGPESPIYQQETKNRHIYMLHAKAQQSTKKTKQKAQKNKKVTGAELGSTHTPFLNRSLTS
ncbi:unnamed protein product [Ectocarpus fasciculatus]